MEELPPSERAAYLSSVCADESIVSEVNKLLATTDAGKDFLTRGAAEYAPELFAGTAADPLIGGRVGHYEIVRELASGGMGRVYLAVRSDDFRKHVAIKLLQAGADSPAIVKRFRAERQILAALEHPNIARLLDGGSTDEGRPYLVMEFIEGLPIDVYCDQYRLSVDQRLRLFLPVCEAVQHAHRNLVVHRDIKPGNVLVTLHGVPKLLDFGIAKLLQPDMGGFSMGLTAAQVHPMTPQYASPEQVLGLPISTATDVYSLGVLLYELLTGHNPYRYETGTLNEIYRIAREQEPLKPSTAIGQTEEVRVHGSDEPARITPDLVSRARGCQHERLRRTLTGDLDNILLRAMQKQPDRRYGSVDQFAEDIRRYLEGLPVMANKESFRYRAGKFIRRNRAAVSAAAIIVLILLIGLATTLWQARAARVARVTAERRFGQVRKLANSVLFEMYDAIEKLPGSISARALLVRRALEYLDALAADAGNDRSLQLELASALARIGDIQWSRYYNSLGDRTGAMASQQRALAIRRQVVAADPASDRAQSDLSYSYSLIGDLLAAEGNPAEALKNYKLCLDLRKKLVDQQPDNRKARAALAVAYQRIGDTLGNPGFANLGDTAGAEENFGRMQSLFEELAAEEPENLEARHSVGIGYEKLGAVKAAAKDPAGALELFRKELAVFQELAARQPANTRFRRDVAVGYGRVGESLTEMGDIAGGLNNFRRMLDIREDLVAADPQDANAHDDLCRALRVLSSLTARAGEYAATRTASSRLLEIEKAWADRPDAPAEALNVYAWDLLTCPVVDLRRPAAALPYARRAVEMTSARDPNMVDTVALAYFMSGDRQRALDTERSAIALAAGRPGLRAQLENTLKRFETPALTR